MKHLVIKKKKSNMQLLMDPKNFVHGLSCTLNNSTVIFFKNLVLKYSNYSAILM